MNIIKPENIRNIRYCYIGAFLIVLNYIRHNMFGYKTPRTFGAGRIDRSINYDFDVVDNWLKYLRRYLREEDPLKNKVVLELGPGPDMGIGLILLTMVIKKYIALDANRLTQSTSSEFYDKLFGILEKTHPYSIEYLKSQLDKCRKGIGEALIYKVDKNFDISKVGDTVDIVFSQATFEHFPDIDLTLKQLGGAMKKGGILVSEIDLKTHTRWIRDVDPLNMYRYGDWFWNIFKFKGSPNRIRAAEYKELFEKNGWRNVAIEPITVLGEEYVEKVKPSLNKKFRSLDSSEMKILSIMVMATKG